MQNTYIVRLKNNSQMCLMCFYYVKDDGILYRTYDNGKWSEANTLIKNARLNYTVTLDESGKMYVLCQNNYGDVLLYSNQDDEYAKWTEKTVLKNKGQRVHPITLYPIISGHGMGLIYNVPIADDKSSHLIRQSYNARGQILPASKVDKIIPMPKFMFQVQAVTPRHVLVFYQTKGYDYNLGYREMTPDSQSRFNIFHSTSNKITDVSFLTTNDSIHVLYIVRSLHSEHLIYRKKEEAEFSAPVVLCEGEALENCLLFFADGNLHATYISGDQLYHSISENNGDSFSRPVGYYSKVCESPVKAAYIDGTNDLNGFDCKNFIREVYVDSNMPWKIQVVPDICKDFYPPILVKEASYEEKAVEPCAIESDELKKIIYALRNELEEKEKAIMSLSNQLTMKNEEISQLDFLRKESQRKLLKRVEELERDMDEDVV